MTQQQEPNNSTDSFTGNSTGTSPVVFQTQIYSNQTLEEQLTSFFFYLRNLELHCKNLGELLYSQNKIKNEIKKNLPQNEQFEVVVFDEESKPQISIADSHGRVNYFTTSDLTENKFKKHLNIYISPFPFDTSDNITQQIHHNRTDLLLSTKTDPNTQQPLIWISDKVALRPKKPITVSMDEYIQQDPVILKELEYKVYLIATLNKRKSSALSQKELENTLANEYTTALVKERLHPLESVFALTIESFAQTCHKFLVNQYGIPDNLVSCEDCFEKLHEHKIIKKNTLRKLVQFAAMRNKISHPAEHNFSAIRLPNDFLSELSTITRDTLRKLDKDSLTENIAKKIQQDREAKKNQIIQKIVINPNAQKKNKTNEEKPLRNHEKFKKDFQTCVQGIASKAHNLHIRELASYLDIITGLGAHLDNQLLQKGVVKKSRPPIKALRYAKIIENLAQLRQTDPNYKGKKLETIVNELVNDLNEAREFRNNFSHGKLTQNELNTFDTIYTNHLRKIKPIFQFIVSTFIRDYFDLWQEFLTHPIKTKDMEMKPIVRIPQQNTEPLPEDITITFEDQALNEPQKETFYSDSLNKLFILSQIYNSEKEKFIDLKRTEYFEMNTSTISKLYNALNPVEINIPKKTLASQMNTPNISASYNALYFVESNRPKKTPAFEMITHNISESDNALDPELLAILSRLMNESPYFSTNQGDKETPSNFLEKGNKRIPPIFIKRKYKIMCDFFKKKLNQKDSDKDR